MHGDVYVEIVIAIFTCIILPVVGWWFHKLQKSIDDNTEASNALRLQMTQLSEHIASGLEPRIEKCEDNIGDLYERTNDHQTRISVLEHAKA